MYEAEVNRRVELSEQLPPAVLARFAESGSLVAARSLLSWSEHCTECVWPSCYSTCEFYEPRVDDRCRRFVDGMVRIDGVAGASPYLLKIRFKQWGKLWTVGDLRMYSQREAAERERRDQLIGAAVQFVPVQSVRRRLMRRRYKSKIKPAASTTPTEGMDAFCIECFNPQSGPIDLSIVMRPQEKSATSWYQALVRLEPGFTRALLPLTDIRKLLDVSAPFTVEVIPNDVPEGTTLFFGLLDFIKQQSVAKPALCKCVVWDLDNTLWNGILVEDGLPNLSLKPQVREILHALDERGILLSVVSKNNFDDGMRALQHFGIADLFVAPQISWNPKSGGVRQIAERLNLGIDAFMFVDDSEFERAEVGSACPTVRILDASEYLGLLDRPEFQVPVTTESRKRRASYQTEQLREAAARQHGDDYHAFLRDCQIRISISRLTPSNAKRVHELAQRTNQMNFSGNRYEMAQLESLMSTPHLDTYVISCEDRFGSYGIVGFSVVDTQQPRMVDLMFSCRVQAKRVEHAFLSFLLRRYENRSRPFHATYRQTERNEASGRVFDDVGFLEAAVQGQVRDLVYPPGAAIPDDRIVASIETTFEGALSA